jgi:hypothetical protein
VQPRQSDLESADRGRVCLRAGAGKGDQMATKKEAKARRAAWNAALAEGRVVRTNDGNTLTAYATVEAARRAVETNLKVGLVAEIVEIKF